MKSSLIILGLFFTLPFGTIVTKGVSLPASGHNTPHYQVTDTTNHNGLRIRQFDLEIVPPSSGVQFYRDGIIFLSHSKIEEKIPEHHISFGSVRIYTAAFTDTMPGQYLAFTLDRPALFPTEATTFTPDYNTMYLSLIPKESSSEKIFRADNTNSGWKLEPGPLEICTGNHIYSHPCLSADGTFMIFSSDMPGTTGGLDLFITRRQDKGWSIPENLGRTINSTGNELFASLDSSNNLYFSSDGLPGKGGYDVYVCRYDGSGWGKPHNLSAAVNTEDDELAFIINKAGDKTAFYTRRARTGRNRTQLFILDTKPVMSGMSNWRMDEYLLADAGAYVNDSKPEKPAGKNEAATSTTGQNINRVQPGKKQDSIQVKTLAQTPENKKESEGSVRQTQTAGPTPVKKEDPAAERQVQPVQTPAVKKDEVVYRVQILANTKAVGSQNITVAGKNYKSFEYLYMGGYRTTIGEFSTLAEASRLQAVCRQNGYSQAFVVAFKNNIRSNDPELFK